MGSYLFKGASDTEKRSAEWQQEESKPAMAQTVVKVEEEESFEEEDEDEDEEPNTVAGRLINSALMSRYITDFKRLPSSISEDSANYVNPATGVISYKDGSMFAHPKIGEVSIIDTTETPTVCATIILSQRHAQMIKVEPDATINFPQFATRFNDKFRIHGFAARYAETGSLEPGILLSVQISLNSNVFKDAIEEAHELSNTKKSTSFRALQQTLTPLELVSSVQISSNSNVFKDAIEEAHEQSNMKKFTSFRALQQILTPLELEMKDTAYVMLYSFLTILSPDVASELNPVKCAGGLGVEPTSIVWCNILSHNKYFLHCFSVWQEQNEGRPAYFPITVTNSMDEVVMVRVNLKDTPHTESALPRQISPETTPELFGTATSETTLVYGSDVNKSFPKTSKLKELANVREGALRVMLLFIFADTSISSA